MIKSIEIPSFAVTISSVIILVLFIIEQLNDGATTGSHASLSLYAYRP